MEIGKNQLKKKKKLLMMEGGARHCTIFCVVFSLHTNRRNKSIEQFYGSVSLMCSQSSLKQRTQKTHNNCPKKLFMAVTAGMIWLFVYVRYRPDRGFDSLCLLPGLVLKYFCLSGEGGGGVLPIMAYTGRYMKRQLGSYSLTEVYERVGKSVIWVCERAQRANR